MEVASGSNDAFRLLRLRFLRPPPSEVFISNFKPLPIPIEIAIGVTDDYGIEVDTFFDSLNLSLTLVDSVTFLPYPSATLTFSDNSSTSNFTIHSSHGHFHSLKLNLTFNSFKNTVGSFRILLAIAQSDQGTIPAILSTDSQAIRKFIGEEEQIPLESWNGNTYMFMKVFSGQVEVVQNKGKGSTSSNKVQTALRTFYVPNPATSTSLPTPLYAVERPGLNNSTGSRIWDCGIALSHFLSTYPSYLLPTSSATIQSAVKIIELGAGCGLAGQVASRVLSNYKKTVSQSLEFQVIETDIEATVNTTLEENLLVNKLAGIESNISSRVLDWGLISEQDQQFLLGSNNNSNQSLTILGSDILYDPDTHLLLYQTIFTLLDFPPNSQSNSKLKGKALIAYKARTEGDDGFFNMVKKSGRSAEKVWEWGEIQVWEIS